jgi:hypothetical protein
VEATARGPLDARSATVSEPPAATALVIVIVGIGTLITIVGGLVAAATLSGRANFGCVADRV